MWNYYRDERSNPLFSNSESFKYKTSKYNNTVHRVIKMKPIDITGGSYVEYNENLNKKDPKFKVGDHFRISKYKNIFP